MLHFSVVTPSLCYSVTFVFACDFLLCIEISILCYITIKASGVSARLTAQIQSTAVQSGQCYQGAPPTVPQQCEFAPDQRVDPLLPLLHTFITNKRPCETYDGPCGLQSFGEARKKVKGAARHPFWLESHFDRSRAGTRKHATAVLRRNRGSDIGSPHCSVRA